MKKQKEKSNSNNIVQKANILNSMQPYEYELEEGISGDMTLTELRFFSLYLSRINSENPEEREVTISITEFEELFETHLNSSTLNQKIYSILKRAVNVRMVEENKLRKLMLYSMFEWTDEERPNEFKVRCNADVLPYLFHIKDKGCYTSYKLEQISKLNSVSKIRFYEIMKQYLAMNEVTFEWEELRNMLFANYTEFRDFNKYMLNSALNDVNEFTDINVSMEKNLIRRSVNSLTFYISKKKEDEKSISESDASKSEND